jgi:hypothetical protein
MYGVNDLGKPYIHIMVKKQRRLYAEIISTSGDIKIRCRDCLQWFNLIIPIVGTAHLVVQEPNLPPTDYDG